MRTSVIKSFFICLVLPAVSKAQQLTPQQNEAIKNRGADPAEVQRFIDGNTAAKQRPGLNDISQSLENLGKLIGPKASQITSGLSVLNKGADIQKQATADTRQAGTLNQIKGSITATVHATNTIVAQVVESRVAGGVASLLTIIYPAGRGVKIVAHIVGVVAGMDADKSTKDFLDGLWDKKAAPVVNNAIDQANALWNTASAFYNDKAGKNSSLQVNNNDPQPFRGESPIYANQKDQSQGIVDMSDKGSLVEGPDVAKAPEKEKLAGLNLTMAKVARRNFDTKIRRMPASARVLPGFEEGIANVRKKIEDAAPEMAQDLEKRIKSGDTAAFEFLRVCELYAAEKVSPEVWTRALDRYKSGAPKIAPKGR